MKLEDLTRDDLLLVAQQLAAGEKLDTIEKRYIPLEIRRIAEGLHAVMCSSKHLDDDKASCQYYKEKSWSDPTRKKWVSVVEFVLKMEGVNYPSLEYIIKRLWEIEGIKNKVEKERGNSEVALLSYFIKEEFRNLTD